MKLLQNSINATVAVFGLRQDERRSTTNALNIFFGAILGVGLGGIEDMDVPSYMLLLVIVATMVMTIVYVSGVETRRVRYAITLLVVLTAAYYSVEIRGNGLAGIAVPDKLLPTLMVWSALTLVTEFLPRIADPVEAEQDT